MSPPKIDKSGERLAALKRLTGEIHSACDRLDTLKDELSWLAPSTDDSEFDIHMMLRDLQDSDLGAYPEEFGGLVGGELYVNRAGFMRAAAQWMSELLLADGSQGDSPQTDKEFEPKFSRLLHNFADDFDALKTEYAAARDAEEVRR